MSKVLLVLLTLVSCGYAFSTEIAYSYYENTPGYATEKKAANAALALAIPPTLKESVEYGGWLFKCGSKYYYTAPVTINEEATNTVQAFAPSCAKWVGTYHTHVPFPATDGNFSKQDRGEACRLRVNVWMGVARTGRVRLYRKPRHTGTRSHC